MQSCAGCRPAGYFPLLRLLGKLLASFVLFFHETLALVAAWWSCNPGSAAPPGWHSMARTFAPSPSVKSSSPYARRGRSFHGGGQHPSSRTTACGMRASSHWACDRCGSLNMLWRTFCCLQHPSGLVVCLWLRRRTPRGPHRPPQAS